MTILALLHHESLVQGAQILYKQRWRSAGWDSAVA